MNTEESVKKTRKKLSLKWKLVICGVLVLIAVLELLISNLVIYTESYEFESADVPQEFDGCVIVQISDFHNRSNGFAKRICEKVAKIEPDYIFITGDTIDAFRKDMDKAVFFLENISKEGECFLVWGNHDYKMTEDERARFRECCEKNGITILENDVAYIERNGVRIAVAGAADTVENAFLSEDMFEEYSNEFTVWLHHFPEDADKIAEFSERNGVRSDVIFSGHAHGGLIGVPFLKFGIYAPGQGFFPDYVSGEYSIGSSELYVSRGLGNSGYTKRFGSSCEILVCTLRSKK